MLNSRSNYHTRASFLIIAGCKGENRLRLREIILFFLLYTQLYAEMNVACEV